MASSIDPSDNLSCGAGLTNYVSLDTRIEGKPIVEPECHWWQEASLTSPRFLQFHMGGVVLSFDDSLLWVPRHNKLLFHSSPLWGPQYGKVYVAIILLDPLGLEPPTQHSICTHFTPHM